MFENDWRIQPFKFGFVYLFYLQELAWVCRFLAQIGILLLAFILSPTNLLHFQQIKCYGVNGV